MIDVGLIQCGGFNYIFTKLDVREYTMRTVDDTPGEAGAASEEKREGLPRNALLALYTIQNAAREGRASPISPSSTEDSDSQRRIQQGNV